MTLAEMRTRVRRSLVEPNPRELTNTLIDDVLNEGYLDFVRRSQILKKSGAVTISPETYIFDMPSDCLIPYRFEYGHIDVPIRNDAYMDSYHGYEWRETTGSSIISVVMPTADTVRIFPVFEDFEDVTYDVDDLHKKIIVTYDGGSATTVTLDTSSYDGEDLATELQAEINEACSSSITVTYSTTTGVFTFATGGAETISITYSGSTIASRLGIIADISAGTSIVTPGSVRLLVDYVYRPTDLSSDSDEPDIPKEYHLALVFYTLAQISEMRYGAEQDFARAALHHRRYMGYVTTATQFATRGFARVATPRMSAPSFI